MIERLGRASADYENPILVLVGTPLPSANTLGVDREGRGPADTVHYAGVGVDDRPAIRNADPETRRGRDQEPQGNLAKRERRR